MKERLNIQSCYSKGLFCSWLEKSVLSSAHFKVDGLSENNQSQKKGINIRASDNKYLTCRLFSRLIDEWFGQ